MVTTNPHVGAALKIAPGEGTPTGPEPPKAPETGEVAPPEKQSLGDQWKTFLSMPGNAAAMMQFGIKAMQPVSPGQSTLGHLGNALGAAGEASKRVKEQAIDAQLKKAQTDYYSGRSQFYSGAGLTQNQILLQRMKESGIWRDLYEQIRLYEYGGLTAGKLGPEQLAELEARTNAEFARLGYPGISADLITKPAAATTLGTSSAGTSTTTTTTGPQEGMVIYPDDPASGQPPLIRRNGQWVPYT